jgi:hypothetical protein
MVEMASKILNRFKYTDSICLTCRKSLKVKVLSLREKLDVYPGAHTAAMWHLKPTLLCIASVMYDFNNQTFLY